MKILIADDHELIRQGLRRALQYEMPDAEVLEAGDAEETLNAIRHHPELDLVLLDLFMPGANGFELLETICAQFPHLPLVALSGSPEPELMRRCIDSGAAGFIPKTAAAEITLKAIELVLAGGVYLPEQLLHSPPAPTGTGLPQPAQPTLATPVSLTQRQIDVLKLLGDGRSNKLIARELDLSENTVKIHVTSIFRALNVNNRTQAGIIAQKMGLTSRKR